MSPWYMVGIGLQAMKFLQVRVEAFLGTIPNRNARYRRYPCSLGTCFVFWFRSFSSVLTAQWTEYAVPSKNTELSYFWECFGGKVVRGLPSLNPSNEPVTWYRNWRLGPNHVTHWFRLRAPTLRFQNTCSFEKCTIWKWVVLSKASRVR